MPDTADALSAIAYGDSLVLETLTEMTLNTLEPSGLDLKTYTMVRIAALVAMDAPPVAYVISVEAAMEVLEPEDIQAVLVALAPVVGSAKVASASSTILDVYFDEADDEIVEAEEVVEADDEIGEAEEVVDEPISTPMVAEVSEYDGAAGLDEEIVDEEAELKVV
jgi:alkylhydroperoxidase/carboxymuconolactone decarboxylase family protein YurZ